MSEKKSKSLIAEQQNLLNKLNSDGRSISFLFGAGTSVPAKLPDMHQLTELVKAELAKGPFKNIYDDLKNALIKSEHIEHILSFLEGIAQLDRFSKVLYEGAKQPHDWQGLILAIKKAIAEIIESRVDLKCDAHKEFAKWLLSRNGETEVYTTNYDLVLEAAFESESVMYFDGFVGSMSPQFQPAAIDPVMWNVSKEVRPPNSWVRLWKLHGSINWDAKKCDDQLIVRRTPNKVEACLIYPSSTKYVDSRRLPFIVLQDKFRRSLYSEKVTIVILGYGFGDEHLNEIIFDALNRNRNLDVNILNFKNISTGHVLETLEGKRLSNLTVFTPDSFFYQGMEFEWEDKKKCELGNADIFFKTLKESVNAEDQLLEGKQC